MKQLRFSFLSAKEYEKQALAAVFFLFFCLFFFQVYFFLKPASNPIPKQNIPETTSEEETISAESPLFKSALFGVYVPLHLSDEDIKQSRLDLEIVGIMYSPKENNSQVLIRAAGGEEHTYGVGDILPGGAMIKKIRQKSILVLHNGVLERLSLPKNELRFEEQSKPLFRE